MEKINNACIEETIKLINNFKKIDSWFTHEKRLIIVFKNGLHTDDLKVINDILRKFNECHYLLEQEALFNHKNNKDYKTIYIELKQNVTINKFAKGGNLTKTNFSREKFINYVDKKCKQEFGSGLKSKNVIFKFDKRNFVVFEFETQLKNGNKVVVKMIEGEVLIEPIKKLKFGGNLDSQMDDFFKEEEQETTPSIIVETLAIGEELVNVDYYNKIKKIPIIKKFIGKLTKMNLYDLGWRFQFGTSRQWAGLCDAGMSEIAKSKTKNIYISIDFVKHDNNWKVNAKSVILHEIAHAIVFEIFHFDKENKGKLHDVDDLHRVSKGHGMVWKAVCKAISGNECRIHYENASFKETFKKFRAECSSCENMDYGDSPNFTDECSKCGKIVSVEPNKG